MKDLTGIKFGGRYVISFDHKSKSSKTYWLNKCDCGNIIITRSDLLKVNPKGCIKCNLKRKVSKKTFILKNITKNKNGCWIWKLYKDKNGYGTVSWNMRRIRAHKLSYEGYYGKVPKGLCVLHKCDNPSCVNPEHLFIGSYQDNTNDMIVKKRGRYSNGEKNGMSKLKQINIKQIKSLRKKGFKLRELSTLFKVSETTIYNVVHQISWDPNVKE